MSQLGVKVIWFKHRKLALKKKKLKQFPDLFVTVFGILIAKVNHWTKEFMSSEEQYKISESFHSCYLSFLIALFSNVLRLGNKNGKIRQEHI